MVTFASADVERIANEPIAHRLDDLRQACDAAVVRLKTNHGWSDGDGRIVAIHRLRNVVQSVLAALAFHRVIFPADTFWRAFFQAVPNPDEFADHYREFDVLVRFMGLHGMFSAAESDLRAIVKSMDPMACGGATAQFDSISRWLLARATSAGRFAKFIDLLRLARNTIHNNGVHRPANGLDAIVNHAGREYRFVVGQPIDFVDWAFVIMVGEQLLAMLEAVANDPAVAGLQHL
jgi:hypothetical protein